MIPFLHEAARSRVVALLDFALFLCGLLTLALFTLVLGWPMPDVWRDEVGRCTSLILMLFVLQEAVRFAVTPRRLALFRSRRLEAVLALVAGLELAVGGWVLAWFHDLGTDFSTTTITLFYLAGTQLTLLAALAVRAIRDNRWLGGRGLSPSMVFILSFAGLITLGTLLLKTPHATTEVGLSWIDALFLATSAVCVTGLSPVDISVVLTPHGQSVLLGLIQIGGLGVMTLTYFFAHFVAGGVSLRNRIGLQDLLSEENLDHIGAVLGIIVAFTIGIELLGAALIYQSLDGLPDAPPNLAFFSLFHAVSAFCNAGFSTLSTNLADPRASGQAGFLFVIMALIVLGGLGFPVVKNVWQYLVAVLRRRLGLRVAAPPRLTANSRLVVLTTAVLIVGGAVLIWFTEFIAGGTRGVVAADSPWLTALFHSVTARTAGFNITPVEALLPASAASLMFLMFVGGSPSSTAGGIKTSTLAVAALSLRRVVLGRSDIEAFGRRLPDDLANRALSVVIVAVAFITIVSVSLCALHPELSSADLVFEAVSAVGTVGLSRNLTPQLDSAAKGVLVFAMLVGRVGVLTFVMAFVAKREPTGLRLPETTVTL